MEVGIGVAWHVEVEDDVDFFNVYTAAEELSGNEDTIFELFKALINLESKKKARSSRHIVIIQIERV